MITKKEINKVLKTKDRTLIFKLATQCGIDVNLKSQVFRFIKDNAPTKSVDDAAYTIAYYAPNYKEAQYGFVAPNRMPIADAINFARKQKEEGYSSYSKILICGNTNIYWASPIYGHEDYNKSRAFANTEKNRRAAELINNFMGFPTYEN
jgi:hypothetical protein